MCALVSIIIPVYKVEEKLLRKCLESCLNQTISEIEIIAVDDCSRDNSSKICDEYADRDNRLIVIHKEQNEGLSAARNTGFFRATGEWITFVDGDDWIEPNTCEEILKLNPSEDVDLVFFGMYRDYNKTSERMYFCYPDHKIYNKTECKQLQIDIMNYYKRLSTAYAKFIRREYLVNNRITHDAEVRCGIEGIEFNVRMFGRLNKAISLNMPLYHYVYSENSITAVPNEKTNEFVLLGLSRMRQYIILEPNHDKLLNQYYERVLRVISDLAFGSYFNPDYKIGFLKRIAKYKKFSTTPVIVEALKKGSANMSASKRIMFFYIRHNMYCCIYILGVARKLYLKSK